MGRESRLNRDRRQQEQRLLNPKQRYPVNTEYSRPTSPASASEKHLRDACDRTFLSLWSYPNLYHNQDGGSSLGKEVCDLLVVFERHVIIFSDKQCDFPDSGDLDVDWARWYRRAIEKTTEAALGRRTWIRLHRSVVSDAACTKRFPLNLAINVDTVFHRLLVAWSIGSCAQELGGSGSLMVNSRRSATNTWQNDRRRVPFMVAKWIPRKAMSTVSMTQHSTSC